jgi:hypothetical protein
MFFDSKPLSTRRDFPENGQVKSLKERDPSGEFTFARH